MACSWHLKKHRTGQIMNAKEDDVEAAAKVLEEDDEAAAGP